MEKVTLDNAIIEISEHEITVTTPHCKYSDARDRFDLLDNELFTFNFTMLLSDTDFKVLKEVF